MKYETNLTFSTVSLYCTMALNLFCWVEGSNMGKEYL